MKDFEYIDNSDIVNVAVGFFIALFIGLVFSYSMIWAMEKEIELGIAGRSSESLLIEYEKNGENDGYQK